MSRLDVFEMGTNGRGLVSPTGQHLIDASSPASNNVKAYQADHIGSFLDTIAKAHLLAVGTRQMLVNSLDALGEVEQSPSTSFDWVMAPAQLKITRRHVFETGTPGMGMILPNGLDLTDNSQAAGAGGDLASYSIDNFTSIAVQLEHLARINQYEGSLLEHVLSGFMTDYAAATTGLPDLTVGALNLVNADSSVAHFDLVEGDGSSDNQAFHIVGNQLKLNAPADFETKDSYSVRVEGVAPDGQKVAKAVTISVVDALDAKAPVSGEGTEAAPYSISSLANLLWLSQNDTEFSKHFVLSADIDASDTATIDGGKGFLPIGTSSSLSRILRWWGHTITGLTINRPDSSYVGLFGYVDGTVGDSGKIQNLTLKDCNIIGDATVGGLVGEAYSGTFENCHISGIVVGRSDVGGLAGYARTSLISACSSTAAVTCAVDPAGGLVGRVNENSTIQFSFSNGSADGGGTSFGSGTGGLVGKLDSSTIKDCYSTASVTATRNPGGLVGISENAPNITNSYSAGPVTSSLNIVTPQGLLAMSLGLDANKAVVNNFWDMEATGANDSVGGFGRPTSR